MGIRTSRLLTRSATNAIFQYATFDPAGWSAIKIELDRTGSIFTYETTPTQPFFDWLQAHSTDFRYEYLGEHIGGEYVNYLQVWFPPSDKDKAMLFKLTFG